MPPETRDKGYALNIGTISDFKTYKELQAFFGKITFERVRGGDHDETKPNGPATLRPETAVPTAPSTNPVSGKLAAVAQTLIDNLAAVLSVFVISTVAGLLYIVRAHLARVARRLQKSIRKDRRRHGTGEAADTAPTEAAEAIPDEAIEAGESDDIDVITARQVATPARSTSSFSEISSIPFIDSPRIASHSDIFAEQGSEASGDNSSIYY